MSFDTHFLIEKILIECVYRMYECVYKMKKKKKLMFSIKH